MLRDYSDTLEKAQKEIKRFRHFCNLIAESDLDKYLNEQHSVTTRAKLNDQEANHALGVLMAIKDKMSKRFISLREAFSKIDIDNSGYVDKHEFLMSCQFWGLYLEEEDLKVMLSYQSDDGSALREGINYKAFLNMFTIGTDEQTGKNDDDAPIQPSAETLALTGQLRNSVLDEMKTLHNAFEMVDVDKSGYVDAGEMAKVFEMFNVECTREMLYDLFETYDTDNDNRFCYDEFARVFEDMTSGTVSGDETNS